MRRILRRDNVNITHAQRQNYTSPAKITPLTPRKKTVNAEPVMDVRAATFEPNTGISKQDRKALADQLPHSVAIPA